MKKFFKCFAVLACAGVVGACGCNSNVFVGKGKSTLLAAPEKAEPFYYSDWADDFSTVVGSLDGFNARLAEAVYKEYEQDDNFAVAPVSVYMALSLASACADGQTKSEILSALGVSEQTLSANFGNLYRLLNVERKDDFNKTISTLKTGNSVWINSQTQVNQPCVENLADDYYCYGYSADFKNDNNNANLAVRHFVREQTNGLIDNNFELPVETFFALINFLYLKDVWNDAGMELPFTGQKYSFEQNDGTVKNTNLLQGKYIVGEAYDGGNFTSFYTSTYSGYKIKFILPDEGTSVSEVFTAENVASANGVKNYGGLDYENHIRYNTRCLFPEFSAGYNGELKDVLKTSFGIKSLFDSAACDFSPLLKDVGEPYCCLSTRHIAKLTVNRRGIEGAAVTVLSAGAAGEPEWEDRYCDFVLDRSFGFVLTDGYNVPLFTGVVNKI